MLLALWFDFWNTADWVTGPTPPPVVIPPRSAGGGHRHESGADWEYWDAREQFLKRHLPVRARADAPEVIKEVIAERNKVIRRVERIKTPNLALVVAMSDKINQLALQIDNLDLSSADDEDAILAILLSCC
jgi:hypothetical protein